MVKCLDIFIHDLEIELIDYKLNENNSNAYSKYIHDTFHLS